jgi:hypothetical protein
MRPQLPIILVFCGAIAGAPAFFIKDADTSAMFLLPFGMGFAVGGFLIARDYRGSIDWVMKTFWDWKRIRVPLAEGRWQARVIGGGMCFVGLCLVAAGFAALLDVLGLISVDIKN